jgi:acetolactate synthase-1/2/3 large subunit
MQRAFATATAGRPGPVVVSLPEDMLRETSEVADAAPWSAVETHPGLSQMAQLQKMLWAAERPFVILGGSRWSEAAAANVQRFAERFELPVGPSFRRQSLFDNDHPNYAGDVGIGINPALAKRVHEADLLILIGGRMSEMPWAGYNLVDAPDKRQLIHVYPSADELGRAYHPTLAINASPIAFAAALDSLQPPHRDIVWRKRTRAANADFAAWTSPTRNPGPVQLAEIMAWLRTRLPDDAIVTNGAGNYAGWLGRFLRFRRFGTFLGPTSGSMGYGLPAAIAAKLRHPERMVVAFAGDGCFQLTSQEFGTAVQYGAAVLLVIVNNGLHGSIRMHQERDYPGRRIATDLVNPDFAALARAYGGHGETVERTDQFAPSFDRAVASGRPAIIDLKFDPEASRPGATLTEIRTKGRR